MKNTDLEKKVYDIEKYRIEHNFKRGYTYYMCEESGLGDTYKQMSDEGKLDLPPKEMWSPEKRKLLTMDLIPLSTWGINARSVLSREVWSSITEKIFEKAGYCCQICGSTGTKHPVECHEIWNFDFDKNIQSIKGLIALCPACHEVKHMGFANSRNRGEIAAKHLSKVNQWSDSKTNNYIEKEFELWHKKCGVEWKVDISYLDKYLKSKPKLKFKIIRRIS